MHIVFTNKRIVNFTNLFIVKVNSKLAASLAIFFAIQPFSDSVNDCSLQQPFAKTCFKLTSSCGEIINPLLGTKRTK